MRGRYYGFCKDFSGRKHQLPSSIVDKLQVTKYRVTPKKKIEPKSTGDLKGDLKGYIHRHLLKNIDFDITGIKKQKGVKKRIIETNHVCTTCSQVVTFKAEKTSIKQVCGCETRAHLLIDKIASKL
jgi:hypothetical protein